jgi:hypothetical protein
MFETILFLGLIIFVLTKFGGENGAMMGCWLGLALMLLLVFGLGGLIFS